MVEKQECVLVFVYTSLYNFANESTILLRFLMSSIPEV